MASDPLPPSRIARSVPVQVTALGTVVMALAVVVLSGLGNGISPADAIAMLLVIWVLALQSVLPFALPASIASLLLFRWEAATYLSPGALHGDDPIGGRFTTAGLHVAAGVYYLHLAAFVGAVFVFVGGLAGVVEYSILPEPFEPFPFSPATGVVGLGGLVIGIAHVVLQLRRYARLETTINRRHRVGTLVSGLLIALAPVIALVIFGHLKPIEPGSEHAVSFVTGSMSTIWCAGQSLRSVFD